MNHSNIRRTTDEKAERAERIEALKQKYASPEPVDAAIFDMADRMAIEIVEDKYGRR